MSIKPAAAHPAYLPVALFISGSVVFLATSAAILILQRALFTFVLCVGALCLLAGNALLATGVPVADIVGFWLAFLVCTIAAERLKLSRVTVPPQIASIAFVLVVGVFSVGAAIGVLEEPGRTIAGFGLLGMTAWLARYDVVLRTIRMRGQPRFMASAMLAGYAWLLVTGLVLLLSAERTFDYDLILHVVFVGFVLSMVFGHALIVFPGLTSISLVYSPWLYFPLLRLHCAVAVRAQGDLLESGTMRTASGVLTAISLLVFAGTLVISTFLAARKRRSL